MTFNFFRRDKEPDYKGISKRWTYIGSRERPWIRSPTGPRTLAENLELVEQAHARRARRAQG